jgi:hypothetical protein
MMSGKKQYKTGKVIKSKFKIPSGRFEFLPIEKYANEYKTYCRNITSPNCMESIT